MADDNGHDVTNVPSIIVTQVNELKLKTIIYFPHFRWQIARGHWKCGSCSIHFCEINITYGFYEAMATLRFRNFDEEDI